MRTMKEDGSLNNIVDKTKLFDISINHSDRIDHILNNLSGDNYE